QRHPAARHGAEHFAQSFRSRTDSLLQLYVACFIQHAVPTVAISQIQSDRQFLLHGKIPALLRRCSATLLHCRSPFYLCFEHVDNLGAYTASRPETGLLIPSVSVEKVCRQNMLSSCKRVLPSFSSPVL